MISSLSSADQRALQRSLGGGVLREVSSLRTGQRAEVKRCTLVDNGRSLTAIIKRPVGNEALLQHESSGLRALAGLAVPQLLAVLPSGTWVLEDLGPGLTLADLLDASDRDAAVTGLMRTAAALGHLHAAARSRIEVFAGLDAARACAYRQQAQQFRDAYTAIERFFAAAGIETGASLRAGCERLAQALAVPNDLFTVTLGDAAPSNVMLAAREPVMFVDLEYCGVRHAFYDAMFWRCICPLPEAVAVAMERSYLEALRDDGIDVSAERAACEMVRLATHRLLWMLSWNMLELFDSDREWARPGLSTRGALLRYLEDYLRFTAVRPHDPALLSPLTDLFDALAERWPRLQEEPFAAFRDGIAL
jgi:aminoglycoside phosphotransferase